MRLHLAVYMKVWSSLTEHWAFLIQFILYFRVNCLDIRITNFLVALDNIMFTALHDLIGGHSLNQVINLTNRIEMSFLLRCWVYFRLGWLYYLRTQLFQILVYVVQKINSNDFVFRFNYLWILIKIAIDSRSIIVWWDQLSKRWSFLLKLFEIILNKFIDCISFICTFYTHCRTQ